MKVQDIMTKNPVTCEPTTKLDEVAQLMFTNDCGEIPVIKSKETPELVGVITDRDICCRAVAQGKNPATVPVSECMTSPVFTVTAQTEISEICKKFSEKEIRRLPVVDNKNCVIGIVSVADLAERAPEQYAREILSQCARPNGPTQIPAH
jgi:CBS domain-containing protein